MTTLIIGRSSLAVAIEERVEEPHRIDWRDEMPFEKYDNLVVVARKQDAYEAVDLWLAQFVAPEKPNACVVIGSHAATHACPSQPIWYHADKAMGLAVVRYYGAVKGLRINMVSCGAFRSGKNTPLGVPNSEAAIADVVAFLLSPGARLITGQNIMVDGGESLLMP